MSKISPNTHSVFVIQQLLCDQQVAILTEIAHYQRPLPYDHNAACSKCGFMQIFPINFSHFHHALSGCIGTSQCMWHTTKRKNVFLLNSR